MTSHSIVDAIVAAGMEMPAALIDLCLVCHDAKIERKSVVEVTGPCGSTRLRAPLAALSESGVPVQCVSNAEEIAFVSDNAVRLNKDYSERGAA